VLWPPKLVLHRLRRKSPVKMTNNRDLQKGLWKRPIKETYIKVICEKIYEGDQKLSGIRFGHVAQINTACHVHEQSNFFQNTAYCNTMHHYVTHWSTLQHITARYNRLQYTKHTTTYCNIVQHIVGWVLCHVMVSKHLCKHAIKVVIWWFRSHPRDWSILVVLCNFTVKAFFPFL